MSCVHKHWSKTTTLHEAFIFVCKWMGPTHNEQMERNDLKFWIMNLCIIDIWTSARRLSEEKITFCGHRFCARAEKKMIFWKRNLNARIRYHIISNIVFDPPSSLTVMLDDFNIPFQRCSKLCSEKLRIDLPVAWLLLKRNETANLSLFTFFLFITCPNV